MSSALLVSPATRFVEPDVKATKRPSALMVGSSFPKFAWFPALSTLTRSVVPGAASALPTIGNTITRINNNERLSLCGYSRERRYERCIVNSFLHTLEGPLGRLIGSDTLCTIRDQQG